MQIAAAYVRVSTDEQTEYSPTVQLEDILSYAQKNNFYIPPEFIFSDEGVSGRKAEKRPGFQNMIRQARKKQNKIDAIIVHKFDRFARNKDDAVLYKAMLKKDGVKVISVKEPIPQDEKFAVIYESMLEAMAEYYSLNLAEEVKKSMVKKAQLGEYQGRTPFGYRKEDKQLVVIPEQAKIVTYIFEKYLSGKSIFQIARDMNQMGWKTARNTDFDTRTLTYILHNPVYKGYSRWTPTGRTDRNFYNPDSIISKGTWEPIIPEDVWQSAADKLAQIKTTAYTHSKYEAEGRHWISGMIKCSACGRSLVITSGYKPTTYIYFQCGGYTHGRCTVSHSVSSRILIPSVINALESIANGEDTYDYEISRNKKEIINDDLDMFNQLISKSKKRAENAKMAFLDGIDNINEYRKNKEMLEAELADLEEKRNEILSQRQSPFDSDAFSAKLLSVVNILNSEEFDKDEKRNAFHSVVEKIIFYKETRKIRLFLHYD